MLHHGTAGIAGGPCQWQDKEGGSVQGPHRLTGP